MIIDKACFDAVLCGDNTGPNSEAFLNEVHRVLNPNGIYINISYGIPEQRVSYWTKKEHDWKYHTHKVAKPYI